jgi:uncharacterized membrane protein
MGSADIVPGVSVGTVALVLQVLFAHAEAQAPLFG